MVDTSGIAPAVERLKLPAGTWTSHREFFVAADDATPLGSMSVSSTTLQGKTTTLRTTETVEAISAARRPRRTSRSSNSTGEASGAGPSNPA